MLAHLLVGWMLSLLAIAPRAAWAQGDRTGFASAAAAPVAAAGPAADPAAASGFNPTSPEDGALPSAAAAARVEPTQFSEILPPPTVPPPGTLPGPPVPPLPVAESWRKVTISKRSEQGFNFDAFATESGESVAIVTGGVMVLVQGLATGVYNERVENVLGPLGTVDIETDRAVIWMGGSNVGSLDFTQGSDDPLEIYMEGNIVFRQGDRTVYADRMFYDVRRKIGVILNAELLTPLPAIRDYQYQGLVRLKAAAVRQLNDARFVAQDALLTTSRLEVPSYHLASDIIIYEDLQRARIDPVTGLPALHPLTGAEIIDHKRMAESRDNVLFVNSFPVFYWPTIATDLEKPSYYIDNVHVRNDSVFGTQLLLELDAYQLFGLPVTPAGTEWNLNLDLLSERGVGFGTTFQYGRDDLLGILGPTDGLADAWFIKDSGVDNLGLLRRDIVPEEEFRGRLFWNHHQRLQGGMLDGWFVQAEVGWISDRTFLEQYYEQEWDERPDQLTGLRLKRLADNRALSVEAYGRINDFFTQTQWLPRVDHYWLGQPLLGDALTWFEHSSAAFADIGVASTPTNATLAGQFERFPWEEDAAGGIITGRGERLFTRQEIDLPINLAPFRVVPYALGELAHWGEDLNGNEIQRAYGQVGVRASIPIWAVNPAVQDPLFNLSGLAHKIVFDAEFSYADANRDLTQFPLYDPLDDDAIEEFRRRLFFSPFGGNLVPTFYMAGAPSVIDPKFDPRYYALRTGIQGWVTSPVPEIADDLTTVRMGMRSRLQTKRGAFGQQRIIDWLTLDMNATWFPNEDRDNFGQQVGLADYDMRWHVGDRFTILSDGSADFFGSALRTVSVGGMLNRPERGNVYLGFRTIDGLIEANVISLTINYRSGPKWIVSGSTVVDIGSTGNIGQSFSMSRIGESLIASAGVNFDESKDNISATFLLEPRFLPRLSLTRKTGLEVPPAGAFFLE